MAPEPRRRNAPAIVMLCIGLLFLVATMASLIPTLLFLGRATAAQASFAGSVARTGGRHNGVFYYSRFTFHTVDGQERTLISSSGSTDQPYQRGQSVTVYYDPHHPDRSTLASFWTLWAGTAFLAAFASVFALPGRAGWQCAGSEFRPPLADGVPGSVLWRTPSQQSRVCLSAA